MDNKTLIFSALCAIAWLLYQIEQRLASFENRIIVSIQGQTQVLSDLNTEIIIEDDDTE